ncbi:MAG TPA: tRNA (guanine-N7)-methyltransferase [Acetobacteraceae bacterium]|nr:tRNA (guanine-N7)-methyltransferase [Acetobacteraceae bacterium]
MNRAARVPAHSPAGLKPPPDRLYGRARGHALRPRQIRLLERVLPLLRFPAALAADPAAAFGGAVREIWLEVGAGGGEHAAAQAAAHPEAGLIACEIYINGLCSLLSRLVPEGAEEQPPLPANLRLWPDDARALIRALPDAALTHLFLLFPDPWPKARHAKRRFVHPALVPELARVLAPGAEWRIATDDPTYQQWVAEVMGAQPFFTAAEPLATRPPGWPPTRYEAKALAAGRRPLYWRFIRR